MHVSLQEISRIFDQLVTQKISREEASTWALEREKANDDHELEFDPPIEKKRIWEALKYLTGVDLLDLSGEYLHSLQNFIDFRNKLKI